MQTDDIVSLLNTADKDNSFFSETEFLSSKVKVNYYTGLPNAELLRCTFEFVVVFYAKGEKHSFYWISFLIILIKLRLNLRFQDLTFKMDVSQLADFTKRWTR